MRFAPALLFSVIACSSGGGGATPDRGPPAVLDAAVVVLDAAPLATSPGEDAAPSDDGAVAAVDPVQLLRDGRKLAQDDRWRDAIAVLEKAAAGGDIMALTELAYAATVAGDDRRATRAAQAVLDLPGVDAGKRATALYHLGRAAELRGDTAAARTAYEEAEALRPASAVADRLAQLGTARRRLPVPAAPPCNRPQPAGNLCACLGAALTIEAPRCVPSHIYGKKKDAVVWAVTVVAREQAPTFLVAVPAKGQLQVLARLGGTSAATEDAELTITRWNVLRGPAGQSLVRVDARMSAMVRGKLTTVREDAVLCVTGATPRCLATVPLNEKVGTPSKVRRLELAIDGADDHGVAHVTVISGPTLPATLLGTHALW